MEIALRAFLRKRRRIFTVRDKGSLIREVCFSPETSERLEAGRLRHARQAKALEPFAREAKSLKPLDPAAKPLVASLASSQERNPKWMLLINERVEVEA
jgi:hypothetical protein